MDQGTNWVSEGPAECWSWCGHPAVVLVQLLSHLTSSHCVSLILSLLHFIPQLLATNEGSCASCGFYSVCSGESLALPVGDLSVLEPHASGLCFGWCQDLLVNELANWLSWNSVQLFLFFFWASLCTFHNLFIELEQTCFFMSMLEIVML